MEPNKKFCETSIRVNCFAKPFKTRFAKTALLKRGFQLTRKMKIKKMLQILNKLKLSKIFSDFYWQLILLAFKESISLSWHYTLRNNVQMSRTTTSITKVK